MTTAEVAERLRRSVKTIQRLAHKGKLPPALKLDGVRGGFLFARQTVDNYANQKEG